MQNGWIPLCSTKMDSENWKDFPLTRYNIFQTGQRSWSDAITEYEKRAEKFNKKLLLSKKNK